MSTTIVENPTVTQDCPACTGILPAHAISIGEWQLVERGPGESYLEREVSMCCPHCDTVDTIIQRKPIRD